jgi:hypothetical protein
VTTADATFREATAEPRVEGIPLAHLSVELGHLYMEDFAAGPDQLVRHFEHVAVWAQAAVQACTKALDGRKPRISTCFLIDDYFTRFSTPAKVVPELIRAARYSGLEIDYLARESACDVADGVPLASLVEGKLVADPPPDTNGSRPPTTETGWLCNGQRSPASAMPGAGEAMGAEQAWEPPEENAANRHSIFLDVELWDETRGKRTWSCPFLAAVWQLLRLGMLRNMGEPVAVPRPCEDGFPQEWNRLPPVVKLNPNAAPFSAYRAVSVLAPRFLGIEHAVRTILSQVAVERAVADQIARRSEAEGLLLPAEAVGRIEYVFISG